MNELILNSDGTYTVVAQQGSVQKILSRAGAGKAVQVTEIEMKTHAWRLPKARAERLGVIRDQRNKKLVALDLEYQLADEGVHPDGLSKTQVAAKKKALRDLPPTVEAALAKLSDTDDISAYDPLS